MHARLSYGADNPTMGRVIRQLQAAGAAVSAAGLPTLTRELVNTRVSQINGCAFCLDMHTKEALAAGESPVRLNLVATWREAPDFTPAERAALELAEQGTRIADGGQVSDEAWAAAAEHYDDGQLTALVTAIAQINAFNTLNVVTRQPSIDYRPGMFG